MEVPVFVYSLAFWTGVSYILSGVLALLVFFKKLNEKWALSAAAVLAVILAFLQFLGVVPELLLRGLL